MTSGLGYIGKTIDKKTIVTRLLYALDWLRSGSKDKLAKKELLIAVVNILRQSPRKYDAARMKKRSMEQLVELAISDVEAAGATYEYQCPWQLEQFTGGEKITVARKKGQHKCQECGKRFRAARKRKYCGTPCSNRAMNRRKREKKLQTRVA